MHGAPGAETLFISLLTRNCDKVTLHLSSDGELVHGGQSYREARQKLMLHSGVNS